MTSITAPPPAPTRPAPSARSTGSTTSRWLVAVPLAWIGVALVHPGVEPAQLYDDIHANLDAWIGVHLIQPFLALGLVAGMWRLLRGNDAPSARVTRAASAVWLVAFTLFDALVGLATGLLVRHSDGERVARDLVDDIALNHLTGDVSVLGTISGAALLTALVGFALSLRAAGERRSVWVTALFGLGLAMHAGFPAAIGLAALAVTFWRAGSRR